MYMYDRVIRFDEDVVLNDSEEESFRLVSFTVSEKYFLFYIKELYTLFLYIFQRKDSKI